MLSWLARICGGELKEAFSNHKDAVEKIEKMTWANGLMLSVGKDDVGRKPDVPDSR